MHPSCFYPECHTDTLLIKTILNGNPNHQHSINKVINSFYKIVDRKNNIKRLKDEFIVGIIDNDLEWNEFEECFELIASYNDEFFIYQRMKEYQYHYLIFINPAIERFILNTADSIHLDTNDFNIPNDLDDLKKITKHPAQWTNEIKANFINLFQHLFYQEKNAIFVLRNCILYLLKENYKLDSKKLIEITNS